MNKKKKHRLQSRWINLHYKIEEAIEKLLCPEGGIIFIIMLPICVVLKTLQWFIWIIGTKVLKKVLKI